MFSHCPPKQRATNWTMGNQLDQSFTPVIHCHSPSMHSMGVSHSKLGGARYGCPAILLYHYQSAPLESQSSSKPFRMFGRKSVEKLVIPQIVAKASHHNNNQCACIYIYIYHRILCPLGFWHSLQTILGTVEACHARKTNPLQIQH